MNKSPVLHNKNDYIKWMFAANFWENKNYKPTESDVPSLDKYPCIVVAEDVYDHRYGRYYTHEEIVELKDFSGAPLFIVDEGPIDDKSPCRIIGIYTNKEDGEREAEYRDDYYSMNYQYQEFKLNELK